MTWSGTRISLKGAQAVFNSVADIEKHQLGHYKATLRSGQILEQVTLMELCQSIVAHLAGNEKAMRDWVAELPTIEACVQNLAHTQRDWRTAFHNNRFEACDGFVALNGELFERYRQLGGTALQIGDLIDDQGNVRTPEDVAVRIEECAIARRH